MDAELYFLKYSFPCAHVLLDMGSITQTKFDELKENTLNNKKMNKTELMMLFPAAFRRMNEVAAKMRKDVWDKEVIKHYFLHDHNMYIDKKEGNYGRFTKTFRDFCKIYKAEVIAREDNALTVKFEGGQRTVFSDILPDAKVGDKVSIHQAFAVEKLE
ncbi:MAG: hypothetical protein ABIB43_02700 [archaeon]